ncbi:MAG: porin [Armatimonadota bacterium]
MLFRVMGMIAISVMLTTMAHAEWKWSGYSQLRYNWWDEDLNKDNDSAFQIRRARLKVEGQVNPDTTITLQADFAKLIDDENGSGDVELKDALITRKLNENWFATAGYTTTPFGFEVPTSDSVLWALERSRVADALFPGQRDTGLYVHYRPSKRGVPQVDLGYGNGLHSWYDANSAGDEDSNSHAWVARANWSLPNKSFAGASYMMADRTRTIGGVDYDFNNQDVFGLHARYNFANNLTTVAEYFDGHQPALVGGLPVNQSVSGWYALAAYTLKDKPITPYYRYDTYDFGGADDYARNTIGVLWDRSKTERFTLQFEDGDDGKGVDFSNFAVQWQVKY